MIRAIIIIIFCLLLSSCQTLQRLNEDERLNAIGSFELNPVNQNSYWYNGKSYEYNEYEIEMTASPVQAKIQWEGKTIGTTPFIYRFSGTLDKAEYIKLKAIPVHNEASAQEARLKIKTELPRKIHFDTSNFKK